MVRRGLSAMTTTDHVTGDCRVTAVAPALDACPDRGKVDVCCRSTDPDVVDWILTHLTDRYHD